MEMIQSFRKRSRVNTDIGKFFSSAEDVRKLIHDLKRLVDEVKDLESEILAVPIPSDTRHQELNHLYEKVKGSSSTIQLKLKVIEKGIEESEEKSNVKETAIEIENQDESISVTAPIQNKASTKYLPVAVRIRKTQYSALLKQFTDVMTNYQLAQIAYRDQIKARLKRQLEITNASFSADDLEDMIDKGTVSVFTKSIMIGTKVAKKNLEDIHARHNDLMKLEQSLTDLAELFQELAQTVEQQGAVIDNIAHNIVKTQEYVDKGKKDLDKAVQMPNSSRKKKVCLLTTGILIITIIAVIITILKVADKI